MADKVKLTPPITDSKTPEWAEIEAFIVQSAAIEECRTGKKFVLDGYPFVTGTARAVLDRHISQALLSAYERGRKERKWQTIETAPRDGSEFLACWGKQGRVIQIVKLDRIHHVWKSKGETLPGFATNATHWMPLPAPPAIRQLLEVKG